MHQATIQLLASSPPPQDYGKPFAFKSARECHAAIVKLENELGITQGPMIFNMATASRRFRLLESLVAQRNADAAAANTQTSPAEPVTATERCRRALAAKNPNAPAPEPAATATVQPEFMTATARCLAAVAARNTPTSK